MASQDPYCEGIEARREGKPFSDNPYETGSDEWNLWIDGRDSLERGYRSAWWPPQPDYRVDDEQGVDL